MQFYFQTRNEPIPKPTSDMEFDMIALQVITIVISGMILALVYMLRVAHHDNDKTQKSLQVTRQAQDKLLSEVQGFTPTNAALLSAIQAADVKETDAEFVMYQLCPSTQQVAQAHVPSKQLRRMTRKYHDTRVKLVDTRKELADRCKFDEWQVKRFMKPLKEQRDESYRENNLLKKENTVLKKANSDLKKEDDMLEMKIVGLEEENKELRMGFIELWSERSALLEELEENKLTIHQLDYRSMTGTNLGKLAYELRRQLATETARTTEIMNTISVKDRILDAANIELSKEKE